MPSVLTARGIARMPSLLSGRVLLGLAIILAAALRLGLANYSFWFDEYASLFFASQPFSRLWGSWMVRETNPPLFYAILRGWLLAGVPRTIMWMRVPSILAGLLVIPVFYVGVRRAFGIRAAIVAALMLAVSAQQIYYSQLVRGYGCLFLAISVSFFGLLAVAMAQRRDGREPAGGWVAYAGGAVAAIYLHDTALLWPAIASLALMVAVPAFLPIPGRRFTPLLLANAAIAVCAFWSLYIVHAQTRLPNGNISWLQYYGLKAFLGTMRNATLLTREAVGWQRITPLVVLGLAAFGAFATRRSVATRFTAICWVVAVTTYWAVSHRQAIVVERTIVWIALFPTILAAAGLAAIHPRPRFVAATSALLALLAANLLLAPSFEVESWDQAVRHAAATPSGALVVSGEGNGVVAAQACGVAFHRAAGCPFPVLTLDDVTNNAWARGFASPTAATPQHQPVLDDRTHLYFVHRYDEQPLRTLKAAGVVRSAPATDRFTVLGPYLLAPAIRKAAQVKRGLVTFPNPSPGR